MKVRVVLGSIVLMLLIMLMPGRAYAQSEPRNSLSGAYMYMKFNADDHHGVAIDFNHDLRTYGNTVMRAVGQLNMVHHTARDITTAAGGVQFAWTNVGHVVPFGEVAAGVFHASENTTQTSFVLNYGVGADIKITSADRWRIRTFLGWATVMGDRGETALRFAAGGQFRF